MITRGVGLSHPDDLSHWYRICKVLYADNSFPLTNEINFLTYPPGTAVWIYIVTKSVGFSVPSCLWGQSLINVAAFCTLFTVLPKKAPVLKKVLLFICISLTALFLCSIDVSTYTLLVDGTLGLVALGIAIYMYEQDFSFEKFNLPVLVVLITFLELIKFSGVIFEVFLIILILVNKKSKNSDNNLRKIIVFSFPVLLACLYRLRNSVLFVYTDVSSQAVSIDRFSYIFSNKPAGSILKTVLSVFVKSFNPFCEYTQVNVLWIFMLLLIIISVVFKVKDSFKKEAVAFISLLKFSFIAYFIYVVSLAITYVFSMDSFEAETLSCIYRYLGTMTVFIVGLFCYHIIQLFNVSSVKKAFIFMIAYICVVSLTGHLLFGFSFIYQGYQRYSKHEYFVDDIAWNKLGEYASENMEYTEDSYLIIWDDSYLKKSNFMLFTADYLGITYFRSVDVKSIYISDAEKNPDLLTESDYDHIIVVGEMN